MVRSLGDGGTYEGQLALCGEYVGEKPVLIGQIQRLQRCGDGRCQLGSEAADAREVLCELPQSMEALRRKQTFHNEFQVQLHMRRLRVAENDSILGAR